MPILKFKQKFLILSFVGRYWCFFLQDDWEHKIFTSSVFKLQIRFRINDLIHVIEWSVSASWSRMNFPRLRLCHVTLNVMNSILLTTLPNIHMNSKITDEMQKFRIADLDSILGNISEIFTDRKGKVVFSAACVSILWGGWGGGCFMSLNVWSHFLFWSHVPSQLSGVSPSRRVVSVYRGLPTGGSASYCPKTYPSVLTSSSDHSTHPHFLL